MADRILLVCTANECRSPYAESVLRWMLRDAGVDRVSLASAGIRVTPGLPRCAEAAVRLPYPEAHAAHRSRTLLAEEIESAGLILVAERRHRADVVRMSPTASARTFTMLEAAALATVTPLDGVSIPLGASVEAFADRLHERRGLPSLIELDIADGHHGTPREHRRTLEQVDVAASAIANALLGRDPAEPASESARRSWRSSWFSRDGWFAWNPPPEASGGRPI